MWLPTFIIVLPILPTIIVMKNIYIELPRGKPKIADINNTKYRVGDILYGNCTSFNSRPAANLTWLINNKTVSMVLVCTYLLIYYLSLFIIVYYTLC